MSNIAGTIFGIYIYEGMRLFRIKSDDGREVYINDDFKPVRVVDDRDLQTVKVRINGELTCPWSLHHA